MAGRPSKYETHVKPRFAEIEEWLQSGATEKEIADNLHINNKIFCKYKKEYKELNELVKNARRQPVQAIKAALFKRAVGIKFTERTITESDKNGVTIQTFEKYLPPDPTAAMMLLKHWDKDTEWTSDPASLKLKKEELEIKKQHMESEDW